MHCCTPACCRGCDGKSPDIHQDANPCPSNVRVPSNVRMGHPLSPKASCIVRERPARHSIRRTGMRTRLIIRQLPTVTAPSRDNDVKKRNQYVRASAGLARLAFASSHGGGNLNLGCDLFLFLFLVRGLFFLIRPPSTIIEALLRKASNATNSNNYGNNAINKATISTETTTPLDIA